MDIAKRIRLARQSKGMTITDVSNKTGITTFDRIDKGTMEPKFTQLLEICKAIDIKIWDLVAEEMVIKYKERTLPF